MLSRIHYWVCVNEIGSDRRRGVSTFPYFGTDENRAVTSFINAVMQSKDTYVARGQWTLLGGAQKIEETDDRKCKPAEFQEALLSTQTFMLKLCDSIFREDPVLWDALTKGKVTT